MHLDVKKIGKIPAGGGWRTHGRSEQVRGRGIGYDYVHAAVDDHSRLAYAEILPDEKGATCAGFLPRAAAFLAGHGLTVAAVLTDNTRNYIVSRDLAAVIQALGARHTRSGRTARGRTARWSGSTAPWEIKWAYRQVFTSNAERAPTLAPWLQHYSTGRRHSALGGLPPISRLSPTWRGSTPRPCGARVEVTPT